MNPVRGSFKEQSNSIELSSDALSNNFSSNERIINRASSKSASEEMTVYLTKRIADIQEQNFSLKQKVFY